MFHLRSTLHKLKYKQAFNNFEGLFYTSRYNLFLPHKSFEVTIIIISARQFDWRDARSVVSRTIFINTDKIS